MKNEITYVEVESYFQTLESIWNNDVFDTIVMSAWNIIKATNPQTKNSIETILHGIRNAYWAGGTQAMLDEYEEYDD